MELALSLGDASKPFLFLDKAPKMGSKDLGFCMGLGGAFSARSDESRESIHEGDHDQDERRRRRVSSDPPVQLNLLPSAPVPRSHASSQLRFPWLTDNRNSYFPIAYFLLSFYFLICIICCVCLVAEKPTKSKRKYLNFVFPNKTHLTKFQFLFLCWVNFLGNQT